MVSTRGSYKTAKEAACSDLPTRALAERNDTIKKGVLPRKALKQVACNPRPRKKNVQAKKKAGGTKKIPQLPSVVLSVTAKGFDFPSAVLGACVTVDDVGEDWVSESEIGSGICVSEEGHILTAGHVAPTVGCTRRVAFASGLTLRGKCVKVSQQYDLALLQVAGCPPFPTITLATAPAKPKCKVVCVGQPGVRAKQRLEANTGKVVSQWKCPLDPQMEVGGLVHTCPVYAGSSGSALLHGETGELVGIHTGFDLLKFEAQAVTLEALCSFAGDP